MFEGLSAPEGGVFAGAQAGGGDLMQGLGDVDQGDVGRRWALAEGHASASDTRLETVRYRNIRWW